MTTCIPKTICLAACIASAAVMLPRIDAFAFAGGGGGAGDGHVGGPGISSGTAGTGSHGGAAGAVHGQGDPGRAGTQGFGWGGPHQHFDAGRGGRHPLPWSPYFWSGSPYSSCQMDRYGRQHCH